MPLGGGRRVADRRAVVGVTAYAEDVVRDGPERSSCRLVSSRYVDAVERVGGVAVLLPARHDCDERLAHQLVEMLDALVLVGGGDVAGRWFGEEDHPAIGPVDEGRDAFEIALAAAALAADLPMLGVCRGMQVMAVADGGSVEQHLPDRLGHNDHATGTVQPGGIHRHLVGTAEGTVTRGILGEQFEASCHHHQGVDRLGGFVASGWSADGVLEVMERPGPGFCVGIQSHPEVAADDRLFAALVATARPASPTMRTRGFAGRAALPP
jgi:putative glutamine amidotransferase